MKKYFYSVLAAGMLFATSCSQDQELVDITKGEGQQVTFKVQIPEANESRAINVDGKNVTIGDGTLATRLIYAQFEAGTTKTADEPLVVGIVDDADDGNIDKSFTVNLTMAKDLTYDFLFMAYNPDNNIFGIPSDLNKEKSKEEIIDAVDLRNLQLKAELFANQEAYDAFVGKLPSQGINNTNRTVPLNRPFAQVNALTTKDDLNAATDLGITVTYSQLQIKAPTVYNIFEEKADEEKDIAYALAPIFKHEDTDQNEPFDNTDDQYYLTSVYVLTDATETSSSSTTNAVLKFYRGENESDCVSTINIPSLPLQRNYRTNVIGNLITKTEDYTVEIKPGFETPDHVVNVFEVSTVEEMQTAIEKAEQGVPTTLILNSNLSRALSVDSRSSDNSFITIPAGKDITIDLNGYTLSQEKQQTAGYAMILNDGNLTIVDSKGNGKISYKDTGAGGEYVSNTITNRGTLTVKSGRIENISSAETANNGYCYAIDTSIWGSAEETIVNVEGGEIWSNYSPLRVRADSPTEKVEANISGGTFYGRIDHQMSSSTAGVKGILNISGGTFKANGIKPTALQIFGAGHETDASGIVANITGGVFEAEIVVYRGNNVPLGKNFNEKFITGGTFKFDPSQFVQRGCIVENNNGVYTIKDKPVVAKIGDVEYKTLQDAVDAVQDGETITLVADEIFTASNYFDNGGWKDGLGYSGDKSFTIDLGGKKISQNGALNDYLMWFKNVGSKENIITIKNGTLDAGTTAFCALCTASSHENKLTINLENVTAYNDISNGSTVKIRAGSVLNVKAGTKITGKNSYLGIENWNATVNIYDGAEIYMNGTSSYNGCLVGVGGNGTINVYGGYGKGVKGGFIAMTSGGTINVSGGEWIANTDGTVGNNSNLYVLTAQSNKYESGFAGPSIINVTGGTFRGGMDAWVLNNIEGEKAELNISGGDFNANPKNHLEEGCEATEANGIWTVKVLPIAKIGETEFETLEAAVAAAQGGSTVTVLRDVTLSEDLTLPAGITLNGNGKQINGTIYAGGNLTFVGHTKVTAFSASYYDRVITIGEGACLEVTGTGRVTLGYGNTFNITGSIENAKTADKTNIQPSLIIPAGISITGGSGATLNVTDAYVQIGDTSSKNSVANGTFSLNFENSIAEFAKQLTFAEPTSGKNPTFNINVKNSVLTTGTKLVLAASGSNMVVDNSIITLSTYFRNSGVFTLVNGSSLTGSTIQFGENSGNNGAITVDDSILTINASSTGHALDGKGAGSITLKNGAEATVTYYKDMTITADETSTFTGTEVK